MANGEKATSFVISACVVSLSLCCFAPVLVFGRQFAFRDISDFYYPLYERVQQEWRAGRLPLWMPEENGGMPLLGNPTAAVLYPGKLIYAVLVYPWATRVYIIGHVLLAFVTMRGLLRHWDVSQVGAALAGLAYAFGAPVLTQYCNVVFLVGAAWMPLGFLAADRWVRSGHSPSLAVFSVVLALQTLGGDPEAAYLTAAAALGYALAMVVANKSPARPRRIAWVMGAALGIYAFLFAVELSSWTRLSGPSRLIERRMDWWRSPTLWAVSLWCLAGTWLMLRLLAPRSRGVFEKGVLGLVCACVLALAIIGVELLPAFEFASQTTRTEGGRGQDIYAYSVHPARAFELFWPNFFGRPFGVNRTWLPILPPTHDHRVWTTSLYVGGLTALLALGAVGARGCARRGWLSVVLAVSLLAACGSFASPLLWLRTIPGARQFVGSLDYPEPRLPSLNDRLRDGDGGVYWFLATLLPGFRIFRYPGKLIVPASLCGCALAGMGWDELTSGHARRFKLAAVYVLSVSLLGLVESVIATKGMLAYWSDRIALATSAFGPLDPPRALIDLRAALIQGSLACGLLLMLCAIAQKRPRLAGILALAGMSVDLAFANSGHIGAISQSVYDTEPRSLAAIRQAELEQGGASAYRVYRMPNWSPIQWNLVGSPERLEQIVRWERDSLRPKYGLPYGVDSTFVYGSAELAAHGLFFQPRQVALSEDAARELNASPGSRAVYFPRRGFDLWNTKYFVLPTRPSLGSRIRGFSSLLDNTEPIYPAKARFSGADSEQRLAAWARYQDLQVFKNLAAYPRAWVVHRARTHTPLSRASAAERSRLMDELLYQADVFWTDRRRTVIDPRQTAWVEADDALAAQLRASLSRQDADDRELPKITDHDSEHLSLEVEMHAPGILVLADVYYPGWTLTVDGTPQEILRVNQAMRGALLSAGKHRLVFRYRPASVVWGAGLSVLGMVVLIGLFVVGGRRASGGTAARAIATVA
jgi:hypothetical protein